jgi:hypothetical protein
MTDFTPKEFSYLYANDKAPAQSLEEKIDLKTCDGHVLRCAKTGKFLYFPDIMKLTHYFLNQVKPYLHSVMNKHRPIRFNLELDMPTTLLNNIVFSKAILTKIEQDGMDVNLIKSLKAFEHVQECVYDVLEEFGVEMSDYKFLTASDNRKEKYSYRIYLKLAFANIKEYKHFITLLKDKVRPEVLPMIDPTSLMLRTPGSYKDNHQCKWMAPCSIDEAILSYTDNCDMIDPQAPEEAEEKYDDLTDGLIKDAVAVIATHPAVQGNYYYTNEKNGFLCLKRIQPSYCSICEREHDKSDAYATVYHGNVHLRCYRDDTKTSLFLGFVGEAEPMKFRWADVRNLMKEQEKLKETGMSNKEKAEMVNEQTKMLEELKKKADENETEMAKIEKYYYTDVSKFHKKIFPDKKQVLRWIDQSIAKIMMGGNSLYITSDFWKGSKHFTEMSLLPCSKPTEAYNIEIINPKFDVSLPIDSGKNAKNMMTLTVECKDIVNEHTMMDFYKAVDFVPYLIPLKEESKEIFNMFEGYKFPYQELPEAKDSPCIQPWIYHIHNVVCSGNAEQSKTLTQWMAHLVQKPTQKAFATIIYGKQGTGKSILYEFFTRCIGKDLGLQVGKLEDLTQSHNTHVRGKLIINANEATNEPAIRDVNILKGLITETDLVINPKGVNQYTVSNYSRLLITSNYKQCMRLDADDRRYFCLEISDSKKNDDEYFAPLVDGLSNEETQQAFFNYLANYDISDFHHQRPPMSAMKRDMIGASADNVILFMKDVCENEIGSLPYEKDMEEITPTCVDVFESYVVWCRNNDEKGRRHNKGKFAENLNRLFDITIVRPVINEGRLRRFKINRARLLNKFKTNYKNNDFEYQIAE